MFSAPARRDFLQVLLGGAAGLLLPSKTSAQSSSSPSAGRRSPPTVTRLNEKLSVISGAGGNVVVATGPDGAVMVNGGLAERCTEVLKIVADQSAGKRVHTLFNTDWHPEHTGSNELLGKAGAQIIAHENTKQYLANDLFVDWQNRTVKALPAPALPTRTFYAMGTMTSGDERIEYGQLGQAHTDGDIYVLFRESNVLVAGDVLSVGKYPIADYTTGGWLGGLMNATKDLLDRTNADTRVVPGVGPLQSRADLQAQHEMLVTLRERLPNMMRQGMGWEEMLAKGATKEFDEKWGDPKLFLSTTYRGLWLHVRELGRIV